MLKISRRNKNRLHSKKRLNSKSKKKLHNGGFLGFGGKKCFDADAYKTTEKKYKDFVDLKSKNPPEYCKILDGIKEVKKEM